MRLAGQVALVTGAGRGIGRAVALAFAREGATVVLAARTAAELDAVAREIEGAGGRALALPADVRQEAAVAALVRRLLDAYGRIDLLVAAAGTAAFGPLVETDPPAWDEMMAINLRAPFLCCRAALPAMMAQRSGTIIVIGSVVTSCAIGIGRGAVAAIPGRAGSARGATSECGSYVRATPGSAARGPDPGDSVNAGYALEFLSTSAGVLRARNHRLRIEPQRRKSMANETVRTGYIVAADVSGYTEFLTGSELEHAHGIMRGVMQVLSGALGPSFEIIKYEGDAILCTATDDTLRDSMLMLDVLEQAYVAFADHLFDMQRATTCTCRACAKAKALDLKFFLHRGQFVVDTHGDGRDISGPDVILLHRLMKNHVTERTGLRAYTLATVAALETLGPPADFKAHEENYEHFGAVACGVGDLVAALEARRAARDVRVIREEATLHCEAVIEAPAVMIWDYFLDPVKRLAWDPTAVRVDRRRNLRGREGAGAELHCAHDSFSVRATTVDWKPFRYFTQEYGPLQGTMPMPPFLMTIETEPLPDGRTQVRQFYKIRGGSIANWIKRWRIQKPFQAMINDDLKRLDDLVSADRAARQSGSGGVATSAK